MSSIVLPVVLCDVGVVPVTVCIEDLYRTQGRRLVAALTVFVGDVGEAEDIAQEAFARVIVAKHRIADPERAISYLYSTAFNVARSRWRRRGRFEVRSDEPAIIKSCPAEVGS